jgi:hypothetical protein
MRAFRKRFTFPQSLVKREVRRKTKVIVKAEIGIGGMGHWRTRLLLLVGFSSVLPATAADLHGYGAAGQCLAASHSSIALLPEGELESRVVSFYGNAGQALDSPEVWGSRSPAFLWARETRFQCGKAIGYLDGGHVHEESVAKCDCAHGRLVEFW